MVARVCRGVVPFLLLAFVVPAFAAGQKHSRPPGELHSAGDHWTAWYPPDPATYPPGSNVYKILKGDTLWQLAAKNYGSPYLWPQLWEANTYIKDAHWIYPGDTLLMKGEAGADSQSMKTVATDSMQTDTSGLPAPVLQTSVATGPPIPLGSESDLYCWGYLGTTDEPMPNYISAFEDADTKYMGTAKEQGTGVATNEIIYIKGGTGTGIIPGETYIVVTPSELINDPKSGTVIGRHYDYRGQVRVLCADSEGATALVTQACTDIHIGDRLKPMPQLPIPLARVPALPTLCDPTGGRSTGWIVNSKDYRYSLGDGALVEVNLGRANFVNPGDFLTVYRESPVKGNPPQLLGEIAVLTAEDTTATGRIIRMRYQMSVGDRVELK
ncbi:MAG: LysM peptidoglycan-binding domain-containing protein [Acidobacteriota bacterium]